MPLRLRETVFGRKPVIYIDHEISDCGAPARKRAAETLVACHKAAAVNIKNYGIAALFGNVFGGTESTVGIFYVTNIQPASIGRGIVVDNVLLFGKFNVFEFGTLALVLRAVVKHVYRAEKVL